jgi:hypothetical protein
MCRTDHLADDIVALDLASVVEEYVDEPLEAQQHITGRGEGGRR